MNTTANATSAQPPLSHFDRLFSDNSSDVLFCSLNEIEPIFTEKEFLQEKDFVQQQTVDPRNKLPVIRSFFDHTIYAKPEIFRSPNRSTLTNKEHIICLQFLQSLKAEQQIYPNQVQCYNQTLPRRQKEQESFLSFLTQFNDASYEKIYAPSLMLGDLYQKFYKHHVQRLMQKQNDAIFQIHTGFPVAQKCGSADMEGTMSDITLVNGSAICLRLDANMDFSTMRPNIEKYFDHYIDGLRENLEKQVQHQVQYSISCEALVFLLSAGENLDVPSEVIVEVVPDEEGECVIHINELLPSRNTGPNTAELVASFCTEVFLKMKSDESPTEIQATGFSGYYSLETISDFINTRINQPIDRPLQAFQRDSLVKWNLNVGQDNNQIQILTRTKSGFRDVQEFRQVFHSLKLEYKSQFGCEVMSKANLLREWLQLQFSNSPESVISRHRIHASTFKTVLQENLYMQQITQELEKRYKVKIPRLLGSLGDFLSLLSNVGHGRYLLRYNPRFPDKLMLYAETKEATSKSSVSLYGLLQESPSDLAFMTLRQLTPIDDMLCSPMHAFYKILPCSFRPGRNDGKTCRKIIDDRSFIEKKGQIKVDIQKAREEKYKKKRNQVKRIKRSQKLIQKAKLKKETQKETTELEEEIEKDRILFGFK